MLYLTNQVRFQESPPEEETPETPEEETPETPTE